MNLDPILEEPMLLPGLSCGNIWKSKKLIIQKGGDLISEEAMEVTKDDRRDLSVKTRVDKRDLSLPPLEYSEL